MEIAIRTAVVSFALLAAVLTGGTASAADAEVTYFEKPPTAEEVAQALKGRSAARKASPLRGRGIEWNQAPQDSRPSDTAPVEAAPGAATAAVAFPVNFDLGSAQVTEGSLPYIAALAGAMQGDPALRLVVEGHTDATGDANRNLVLSWDRALTVYKVLVNRYNIDPHRLRPEGKGMAEPLVGTSPHDGVNRRVQFRPIE